MVPQLLHHKGDLFLYKVTVFLVSMKLLLLLFSRSVVSDSLQPHGLQASLSFTVFWSLLRLMSIESVMLSDHLILGHTLLLLPSIFPSIKVFPNDLALPIRWSKYWSFSFSISLFNEYWRLISFRIDWFDPYCPWDSQEPSPAQFKSISSSVLSLLDGPVLISVHDYWKKP